MKFFQFIYKNKNTMMINKEQAIYLANEYKKNGNLKIMELSDLLYFILHNDDFISFEIANIAFSKDDVAKGFDKSPLSKFDDIGFFHPDEIKQFLFYYKWSLNNDATKLRSFANVVDTIQSETDNCDDIF